MSVIKDKILYSKDTLKENVPDIGSHQNFGDFVLSFLDGPDMLDKVWLVNAGYDLTGYNSSKCGKVSRTYGELEPMARSFGRLLSDLDVHEGSYVQMLVPNNTDYHAVVIGAWLNRAIVSLSDPNSGKSDLIQQLQDTKAVVVVFCEATQAILMETVKGEENLEIDQLVPLGNTGMTAAKIKRIYNDKVNKFKNGLYNCTNGYDMLNGHEIKTDEDTFNLDETVVVIWSSGTTGQPKGIMHAAKYLATILIGKGWTLRLADVITTTCFFHVGGFLTPLILLTKRPVSKVHFFNGDDLETEIELLYKACDKYKTNNGLICGSHHLAKIASTDPPLGSDSQGLDLSHIIFAMPTGTTASGNLFQELKKKFPNLMVVPNFYGLTEFGRTIAYSLDTRILGAVGAGTMVKIVDTETGEALGPNQIGEIMAKSDSVMKGYLNRPEETKAFFGDDGFVHTGDMARYDENGVLYYEGRLKDLIKYKARHLYPLEIEKILEEHPDILEAGVFGKPDPLVQEHVAAAVVLAPNSKLTSEDVEKLVEAKVDDFKRLRGGVIFLDRLPRNPQGKIQRSKLLQLVQC